MDSIPHRTTTARITHRLAFLARPRAAACVTQAFGICQLSLLIPLLTQRKTRSVPARARA
jgi:hypothetical protein